MLFEDSELAYFTIIKQKLLRKFLSCLRLFILLVYVKIILDDI